jgi:hypothetical protein
MRSTSGYDRPAVADAGSTIAAYETDGSRWV